MSFVERRDDRNSRIREKTNAGKKISSFADIFSTSRLLRSAYLPSDLRYRTQIASKHQIDTSTTLGAFRYAPRGRFYTNHRLNDSVYRNR
jgi:hypothetical protein